MSLSMYSCTFAGHILLLNTFLAKGSSPKLGLRHCPLHALDSGKAMPTRTSLPTRTYSEQRTGRRVQSTSPECPTRRNTNATTENEWKTQ
uniref:Secreted protein n=1 Tax=Triticum urartu TaxID=4572 RepID=A0A8R7R486_TRIUA